MKNRTWLDIIIIILVCLISGTTSYKPYVDETFYAIYYVILRILFLVFIFVYYKYRLEAIKFSLKDLYILPFFVAPFSNLFVGLFSGLETNSINATEALLQIVFILFTAICEEITFRMILIPKLEEKQKPFLVILYSSLIFGAVHLININSTSDIVPVLLQVLYSFGLGILLGMMYLKTKNLFYCILLHFAFNYFNSYFSVSLFQLEYNAIYFIVNISVAVIIGLYGLFYYLKVVKDNAS